MPWPCKPFSRGHRIIWSRAKGGTEFLARAILYAIERKRAQERLTYLAQYDQLTGLVNRTLFRDRLVHAMARSKRKDQPVGIMLLDLDRFKMVNDTFGHDIGDQLLKSVADRLKNCVREVDTIARMGGDEFTAILEGISGEQDVAVVARRIVESITEPFILGQGSVSIGVSIGITLYPLDDQNVDGLLKHADAAMYRAKAARRKLISIPFSAGWSGFKHALLFSVSPYILGWRLHINPPAYAGWIIVRSPPAAGQFEKAVRADSALTCCSQQARPELAQVGHQKSLPPPSADCLETHCEA